MFIYTEYIIYIIYSFLLLFLLYILLEIYKYFSIKLFKMYNKEIIMSEKKSSKHKKNKLSNTTKKVKKIINKYKIKSTEKTYEDVKFISEKPNYININNNEDYFLNNFDNILNNSNNIFDKIKTYKTNEITKKITDIYLKTKQEFYNLYVNSKNNEYFINNLKDFELFYKNISLYKSEINIIFSFYNEYNNQFIILNKNKMIKIIYNDEFINLCNMIEKNNGPFMLKDNNNYAICYGGFTVCELNYDDIVNVFFSNISNYMTNKNYLLLKEFKFIKIYFFVSNKIY